MPDVTTVLMGFCDQDVARAIALRLEAAGHTVLIADDPRVGPKIPEECQPDLILLDVQLLSVGGLRMLSRLKQMPATRKVPILAISDDEAQARLACVLGAARHLSSPFTTGALLAEVQKTIAGNLADPFRHWEKNNFPNCATA